MRASQPSERLETFNPSIGRVLATLARGQAADIDIAVWAARKGAPRSLAAVHSDASSIVADGSSPVAWSDLWLARKSSTENTHGPEEFAALDRCKSWYSAARRSNNGSGIVIVTKTRWMTVVVPPGITNALGRLSSLQAGGES